MTNHGEFASIYRSVMHYEQLLPPHYYDGMDDVALVAQLMRNHYGDPDERRTLRILELGCGTGRVADSLAPYAHQLVGVDSSRSMTEAFKARHAGAIAYNLDMEQTVTRMSSEGPSEEFDVIGAFWSLNYALGQCFETMDSDGIRPVADIAQGRAQAGRLVRDTLQLLTTDGHFVVLFFDSDTPEQRLVTRLWERIQPFPGGGRHYTRCVLLDELREAENRGQGWLTYSRRGGVAVAFSREAAREWFTAGHLKNFPALVGDPEVRREVDEFVESYAQPSGEVLLPSGVYLVDFHARPDAAHHLPSAR